MNIRQVSLATLLTTSLASTVALADDVEIGSSTQHGMDIAAVYIQPVMMQPMLPGMKKKADIHLEADISATADNKHGFSEGDWMPYLTITYTITKLGDDWKTIGTFMPMAAADGPHYASNIKLDGAGKYHLSYHIEPATRAGFYRHTDKETGIPKWWEPIDLEWDFVFSGFGKKGGY
ncbi:MAG: iron transporter [Amphritea sp.]